MGRFGSRALRHVQVPPRPASVPATSPTRRPLFPADSPEPPLRTTEHDGNSTEARQLALAVRDQLPTGRPGKVRVGSPGASTRPTGQGSKPVLQAPVVFPHRSHRGGSGQQVVQRAAHVCPYCAGGRLIEYRKRGRPKTPKCTPSLCLPPRSVHCRPGRSVRLGDPNSSGSRHGVEATSAGNASSLGGRGGRGPLLGDGGVRCDHAPRGGVAACGAEVREVVTDMHRPAARWR